MSETHTRPHFASHTQSSLMKRRTPMKKKSSSMASSSTRDANGSKRLQTNTILRLNRVHKRQSNIIKQSRSMQMLIMILKQQRDRRATVFLSDNELTGMTCQLENSFVSFGSNLIRNVSHDLKKCVGSPAKLAILHGKPIKIDESEKRAEDVHAFPQDETNCAGRENSEDIHNSSEDRAIVDIACKLQLRTSDRKEPADLCHRRIEPREKPDNFPNEDCPEIKIQVQPQDVSSNVNAATNRKRTRKLWNKKVEARNEYVDHAGRTDLHVSKNMRFTKYVDNPQGSWLANDRSVVNDDVTTRKRGALQKNFASNQRAWRPPGVPKTCIMESATSLTQPISQNSSQSIEKSTTSKNKHSSIEHVE